MADEAPIVGIIMGSRSDWATMREAAEMLLLHSADAAATGKLVRKAEELFDALAPIEEYWAFPGAAGFEHLRRLLDQRNIEDLAVSVRRASRALSSGAYRRRSIPLHAEEIEGEDFEDESPHPCGQVEFVLELDPGETVDDHRSGIRLVRSLARVSAATRNSVRRDRTR